MMKNNAPLLPAALLLLLAACNSDAPSQADTRFAETGDIAPARPAPDTDTKAPVAAATQPFNLHLPGPDQEKPEPLLRYWKQAVEAGDRTAARRAWRQGIGSGGTAPRWSNLSDIVVNYGTGRMQGAAGSIYYEVPVVLKGTGASGNDTTLEGRLTLRRVNDVPGANTEQLSWRIASIDWDG
ncbi:hypothetical protein RM533_04325 [Croceicoccus sp. F390]|uniref:Lipoprotein n=1 Tax=Croceicoccus esteveae TaxID=3075597 RepID=A0ABU2ZFN1_9SPHN|nr:hypothetical protein [Croceicoccus sp. F390]MDT0575407.1 hypothetical protein [Croceicoccus sp. F390]